MRFETWCLVGVITSGRANRAVEASAPEAVMLIGRGFRVRTLVRLFVRF